jgi:hypothetical protein
MKLRIVALAAAVAASSGCLPSFSKQQVKVEYRGKNYALKESGAIIVGGRQVAKRLDNGKVVAGKTTVAWMHDDSVRIKGGVLIPFREDKDGTIHLSKSAQAEAELNEVTVHITADGKYTAKAGGTKIDIDGDPSAEQRRLLLVVLLVDANNLWP